MKKLIKQWKEDMYLYFEKALPFIISVLQINCGSRKFLIKSVSSVVME